MKPAHALLLISALVLAPVAPAATRTGDLERPHLPWREAGWSERAAAAHLLDRLTFGARPGEIDRVVEMGLDRWLEAQLAGGIASPGLDGRLGRLPALDMSAAEIAASYPPGPLLLRRAQREGVLSEEEVERIRAGELPRAEALRRARDWMEREGIAPERVLLAQTAAQKLLAATYSENQLEEVLVDFWFNHFNVSVSDPTVRGWVLAYERDAIRPHVLSRFRDLLGATAKHPAMLLYLDNATSVATDAATTTLDLRARRPMRDRPGRRGSTSLAASRSERPGDPPPLRRPTGLNENYARELLELQTLGVDGGYTQRDVVEVARAFTGWTLVPRARMAMGEAAGASERLERVRRAGGRVGFVLDGDFLFRADAHDAGEKRILGHRFPAGGGVEEGERVLDLLAAAPATARHLARKLAVRFVSDQPPAALIERLAARFESTGGDLRALVRELVESPEFWAPETRGAKIKSPFELAASALRALDADLVDPLPMLDRIAAMGEPLYAYAAPTGFPDRADFWVNTGALLARMNFGLELAGGRIPGVRFDLRDRLDGREPESAAAALGIYGEALMPERDLEPTRTRLAPLLGDPRLVERIGERTPDPAPLDPGGSLFDDPELAGAARRGSARRGVRLFPPAPPMARPGEPPSTVEAVVGLLLGSPEFQNR